MNTLVFVGSLRAGSISGKVADFAVGALPDGSTARVWDYVADLPHYSEDYEGPQLPELGAQLRAAIDEADALLFVTPEYNGALPSGLKNVIDWASRPYGEATIKDKPVAVIGTSGSSRAAQWSRENAVRSLQVASAGVLEETVGVGSHFTQVTDEGVTDDETAAAIRDLLHKLHDAVGERVDAVGGPSDAVGAQQAQA